MMPGASQAFIAQSRTLLTSGYLPRIERCLDKISDPELWWRPTAESNSVGNLLLHLSGNVRQWIISGVGGAVDERRRQREFDEQGPLAREEVWSRLTTTVEEADRVLAAVDPAMLLERRRIQGFDVTILEAIYHVIEHFSMHTGQIILLTKIRAGDLGLYAIVDGLPKPQW